MFGYLQPCWSELRLREIHGYRAQYCGLCHALKEQFGWVSSLTLSYDATLLALVAALYAPVSPFEKKRCVVNPFKHVWTQSGQAGEHAAGANILYAYHKCRDDAADEGTQRGRIGMRFLARPMKKAALKHPEMAQEIETHLQKLVELEKQNCDELDLPAGASGDALATAFTHIPGIGRDREALQWFGYHLGRWIYLCDAYDDLESDAKNSSYNVLLLQYGSIEQVRQKKELLEFNLYYSLRQAEQALELLKRDDRVAIIHNIVLEQGSELTERLLLTGTSRKAGEKNRRRGFPVI